MRKWRVVRAALAGIAHRSSPIAHGEPRHHGPLRGHDHEDFPMKLWLVAGGWWPVAA
jgi:hypothetical protein